MTMDTNTCVTLACKCSKELTNSEAALYVGSMVFGAVAFVVIIALIMPVAMNWFDQYDDWVTRKMRR